jgi:hypothetical protein
MTCKKTDLGGGVTEWSCSRGRRESSPPCETCKVHEHTTTCAFELRGSKAGQQCGRKLCGGCAVVVDGSARCPPHARMQRGAAP